MQNRAQIGLCCAQAFYSCWSSQPCGRGGWVWVSGGGPGYGVGQLFSLRHAQFVARATSQSQTTNGPCVCDHPLPAPTHVQDMGVRQEQDCQHTQKTMPKVDKISVNGTRTFFSLRFLFFLVPSPRRILPDVKCEGFPPSNTPSGPSPLPEWRVPHSENRCKGNDVKGSSTNKATTTAKQGR